MPPETGSWFARVEVAARRKFIAYCEVYRDFRGRCGTHNRRRPICSIMQPAKFRPLRTDFFQVGASRVWLAPDLNFRSLRSRHGVAFLNLKNKIVAKKRVISKYRNKIQMAKNEWNELFPIEEYPLYKKAMEKINRTQTELNNLMVQINEINFV